jgi:hypothetical protein
MVELPRLDMSLTKRRHAQIDECGSQGVAAKPAPWTGRLGILGIRSRDA